MNLPILEVIDQAWDAVFHQQIKHREEIWQYVENTAEYFWRISKCLIWWWNTVSNAWYYFPNEVILGGEIKDSKMSSFSSGFQTLT